MNRIVIIINLLLETRGVQALSWEESLAMIQQAEDVISKHPKNFYRKTNTD